MYYVKPLKSGKYEGFTRNWVIQNKPDYVLWCKLYGGNSSLSEYAKEYNPNYADNIIFNFGKYKGNQTYGWVQKNDPNYVTWCKKIIRDQCKAKEIDNADKTEDGRTIKHSPMEMFVAYCNENTNTLTDC